MKFLLCCILLTGCASFESKIAECPDGAKSVTFLKGDSSGKLSKIVIECE